MVPLCGNEMILQTIRWAEVLGRLRKLPDIASEQLSKGDDNFIDMSDSSPIKKLRPLDVIKRAVVHQAAAPFGVGKQQLRQAGGDRHKARLRRFRRLPYHYFLTLDGYLIKLHSLDKWTPHAKGAPNRESIGICCEGLFPRFERKRTKKQNTVHPSWRDKFAIIERDISGILERKIPLVTHIQCSRVKRADPGEAIMWEANNGWEFHDREWTRKGGIPQYKEWRQTGPS